MELIITLSAALILGILTGLGIGGGSLLLLYLTGFLNMPAPTARAISLLFFFPAALVAGLRNPRTPKLRSLLPAIVPGILSALLFSLLGRALDPKILRKLLGLLFLFLGLRELFCTQKKRESHEPS